MLESAGLGAKYCEYAIEYAAHVKNRLPHSALSCSPFESLTSMKPALKLLRAFGCAAFLYNETPKSKFHSSEKSGTILSSDDYGRNAVELIEDKNVFHSVQVTFDEKSFPALKNSDSSSSGEESNDRSGLENNWENSKSRKQYSNHAEFECRFI